MTENYPSELELSAAYLKKLKPCAGIGDEQLRKMAEEAIGIGAKNAVPFAGGDLRSLLPEYGVKVETIEGGVYGNRLLRAQYDDSVHVIYLYSVGVKTVLDSGAPEILGIPADEVSVQRVLLWHEFFHVLEFKKIGLVGRNYRLPAKMLGFPVHKPLYAISEICANAFAMRVLSLRFSPFLIDYLETHAVPGESPDLNQADKTNQNMEDDNNERT